MVSLNEVNSRGPNVSIHRIELMYLNILFLDIHPSVFAHLFVSARSMLFFCSKTKLFDEKLSQNSTIVKFDFNA